MADLEPVRRHDHGGSRERMLAASVRIARWLDEAAAALPEPTLVVED